MISGTILQDTIAGTKELTNVDVTVTDADGQIVAATQDRASVSLPDVRAFLESQAESAKYGDCFYSRAHGSYEEDYVVVTSAGAENAELVGKMMAFQIRNLLVAYKEQFDKENFVKNLLLDNLLYVDIYNRAKKLSISTDAKRVVMILESEQSKDYSTLEAVKTVFSKSKQDFVTAIDEKSIIVIKELAKEDGPAKLHEIAESILSAVGEGEGGSAHVAYGSTIHEIREVSRSYKEARMALDVGKIFFDDQDIIAYSQLGIGRLIYQLPIPLCKMFIREIFKDKSPENFDAETTDTINKFFEHSLNVSETSRQLYIHRNTLVYRLDKLEKSTGLDLRVFDDAITFKIALMVVKYMKYMETLEY